MKNGITRFAALLLALLLVSCAMPLTGMAETEIVVWTFLDPTAAAGRGKVLANAIEMYEQANPGVKVTVESLQWDTMTAKFLAAHQTNNGPDVIFVNSSEMAEVKEAGALEPLENLFLKDWSAEQISDIDDARFQFASSDGQHYQLFLFANVYGIMYRTDIFEKFDVDPNFTSWEQVVDAARKMTYVNEDGLQVYGLGTGYSETAADSSILAAHLFSTYGSVVDEQGQPIWTGDDTAKMLQLEMDIIHEGLMPESAITQSSDEVYTDFNAGTYAMVMGGTVRMQNNQAQCAYDPAYIGFTSWPQIEGNVRDSYFAGWCVGVWSGSSHKEEAGKFVETLASAPIDAQWVTEGGQIPLLKSTVESLKDFFSADPLSAFLVTGLNLLGNAAPDNDKNLTTGFKACINRSMQYAFAEGYSVEDALSATAQEFLDNLG